VTPIIPYFQRVIFHIPLPAGLPMEHLEIHGFGVLVALGFLLGGWLAMHRARRHGDDSEAINRLIGWLVVGTFVGGHVGYGLMYKPVEYLTNPVKFLYVWEGLSSMGGFLVCVPLTVYFFKRYGLRLWANLDHMAFGFSLGWFFGRLGCTVAHDHPGIGIRGDNLAGPVNLLAKYCRPVEGRTLVMPQWMSEETPELRWGPCLDEGGRMLSDISEVVPLNYPGVIAAHDMGFYEALLSLGTLILFVILDRRPQVPGLYPLLLGVIYGPARLLMDALRPESTDGRWFGGVIEGFGGFTPGQAGSALIFAVCAHFLVQRFRAKDSPYWLAERPKPVEEESDPPAPAG
jgi:prolipoprotein diacylglyceryltransferase